MADARIKQVAFCKKHMPVFKKVNQKTSESNPTSREVDQVAGEMCMFHTVTNFQKAQRRIHLKGRKAPSPI